jgi:DNA repair photolyase
LEFVPAKTIVTRTKRPAEWFGADYTMNLYRGCSHGCIYCDSRSDCYREQNFDTIKVKEDALRIVRDELRRKVKKGVIVTGAMSDPYNPLEKSLCLTRNALELINAYEFGVAISTKSALITRDIDILNDIKTHSPVIVKITITCIDDNLASKIEPHVSLPSERFAALETLAKAGIFCGVLAMPILPFLCDTEENLIGIVEQAKKAGAKFIYPSIGMTLRSGNREYYYEKLDTLFPGLRQKYEQKYGERYYCQSPKAKKLWSVLASQCDEHELLYDMKSITRMYQQPYEISQLSFL